MLRKQRVNIPWVLLFAMVWTTTPVSAQVTNFYVDSTVGASGDGSLGSPWQMLANINWAAISSNVALGTAVNLNLKCGGRWTETLTVTGTGPGLLTVKSYGSGDQPEIHADDPVTGWVTNADAASPGNWKAPF